MAARESQRHLSAFAGSLQLVIRRTASPREIVIETRYSESVSLPFFNHSFSFHPRAVQPL